jgi:hypothetical protein
MYLAIGFSSNHCVFQFLPKVKKMIHIGATLSIVRGSPKKLLGKNAFKFSFFEGEKYKQLSTSMCKKAYLLYEMPGLPAGNQSPVPLPILRWTVL